MGVPDANQERVSLTHAPSKNLLHVSDLSVNYRLDQRRESSVLKQIDFTIACGEIVGLLGESGSGKTTTALSIIRLLPTTAHVTTGSIRLDGLNLLTLNERELREIRGSEISIIHQDSDVLNPVMRVGNQVMEILRAHKPQKTSQMREEIFSLFTAIGLRDHERIYRAFPHQLSGGERRRIAIAQALICRPRLIIADEPTAWLDSDTAAEILAVFQQVRRDHDTAILLISHDPDTLTVVDRIIVMYAGEIIESGLRHEVFEQPAHPYTSALLQCRPRSAVQPFEPRRRPQPFIPGQPPDPSEKLPGCTFSPRCSQRMEVCDARHPHLYAIGPERSVRCFQHEVGAVCMP
jgi:oligopeptide/dipeptide ABC transporter ATP-binding protein